MAVQLLLKLIGLIVIVIVGLALLGLIMHLLGFLVSFAFGLALLIGFFYMLKFLFGMGAPKSVTQKIEYKLFDTQQKNIALFLREPTVQDLLISADPKRCTELYVSDAVLEIDNNTNVIVLGEQDKEAVHVKINDGKWRGKSGWVCRSAVVAVPKLIGLE